jgi:hypothetical protein
MTVPAANFPKLFYYEASRPFINLLRCGNSAWDRRAGNTGWWENVTTSGTWSNWEAVQARSGATTEWKNRTQKLKTGTYVARWTGTYEVQLGATDSDASWYSTGGLVSANRYEFTVLDERCDLHFRVRSPGSGSIAGTLNDLVVMREDEETRHDAGEILSSDFYEAYRHFDVIRFMDAISANTMGLSPNYGYTSVERDDYMLETDRTWAGKFGCDIWLAIPVKMSRACMAEFCQEIYDTGWTGTLYAEYGNEYWNDGFSATRTWLTNTKAQGLDDDGTGSAITCYNTSGSVVAATGNNAIQCAGGHGATQFWYEAEQVFGRSRVKRVIGGQHAAIISTKQHFYVDNGFTGNKVKEDLDIYAVAPYYQMSGSTAPLPSTFPLRLIQDKAYEVSAADLYAAFKYYIDNSMVGWNTDTFSTVATLSPQAIVDSYETGFDVSFLMYWDKIVQGDAATVSSGKLVVSAGAYTDYISGERIAFTGTAHDGVGLTQSSPSSSMTAKNWYYVRRTGTNSLWVYPSQAAYAADTGGTGVGAITMDTATGGYSYYIKAEWYRGSICWGDTGDNTLDFGVDITDTFEDGDKIYLSFNQAVNLSSTTPGASWSRRTEYLVKLSGTTKLRAFSSQANYDSDTEMAVTDGTTTFWLQNMSRFYLMDDWFKDNIDGQMGADLYEYAADTLFTNIRSFNHYTGSGSYIANTGSPASWNMWGLREDEYNTPPPRATWLYSLDIEPTPEPTFNLPRGAGSNRNKKKERKYVLEMDNKMYQVSSLEEARAILQSQPKTVNKTKTLKLPKLTIELGEVSRVKVKNVPLVKALTMNVPLDWIEDAIQRIEDDEEEAVLLLLH